MKKALTALLITCLLSGLSVSAMAYNYDFSAGPIPLTTFGGATSTDADVIPDPLTLNTQRDKDAAQTPPAYSFGFGTTSTSAESTVTTKALSYSDGSIGKLYVAKSGKTIKVFEGATLENFKKGAGHFTGTSAWDGNVALAGHNRGTHPYFSFVKNMKTGDKLTYTTPYGKRTYKVYRKVKVRQTNTAALDWSEDDILTLITCVENQPNYRWVVQAKN